MRYDMRSEECHHCWHPFTGVIWMVLKPGHVLEQCCKCQWTRQVHMAHTRMRPARWLQDTIEQVDREYDSLPEWKR